MPPLIMMGHMQHREVLPVAVRVTLHHGSMENISEVIRLNPHAFRGADNFLYLVVT